MRVQHLHLVEIGADGVPGEDLGALSQFAADACAQTVAHYRKAGFSPPWISFFARCDSEIVGVCAFTSAPTAARVEIAYHTFPPFEGQGVATAMIRELLTRAGRADPEIELFAHTLPEHNASNAILRKLGFEFFGEVIHPEEGTIWEWRHKVSNQAMQDNARQVHSRFRK
jgi:[ribosomal protein S5]-alanine N-acetyltransferase